MDLKENSHLKSRSTEGVEWTTEPSFFGLHRIIRSGLRESTLSPIRSCSWRDDIELSDNAELGRRSSSIFALCWWFSSRCSIGFWRDRMCLIAVSDRFVRCSRFLWIGAMSMISGFGSNVTEHCEPWLDSGWSGCVSSTDNAKRWNRSTFERCELPRSFETFLVRVVWCLWCRDTRRLGEDDFRMSMLMSWRFGTESLLDNLRCRGFGWTLRWGELEVKYEEISLELQSADEFE